MVCVREFYNKYPARVRGFSRGYEYQTKILAQTVLRFLQFHNFP